MPPAGPRRNVRTRGIRDALFVVRQRARLSCVILHGHAYPLTHGVACPINDDDHTDVHTDGNGIVVTTDGRPHDGGTNFRTHNLPTHVVPDEHHT